MSRVHDKSTAKPGKPSPDFPLFAHNNGLWAKKIKGKLVYFGSWDDPAGALERFQDHLAGRPVKKREADSSKPAKPYAEFPLFAHSNGQWAKKIRGVVHYFGQWADPDGAVKTYLEKKDALHAGRKPRPSTEAITVKDVANAFLNHKNALLESGELSVHTFANYERATKELVLHLGKSRRVSDLDSSDFASFRNKLAKKSGPHRLAVTIQHVRSVFKHAYEADLIPIPVKFGPGFKRPTKKTFRLHRAKQGIKLFTADELQTIIKAAGVPMKAMILLGINCGMGNSDCGNLPIDAVDLADGWITYPRPKTGVARRCPLWPETVKAMKQALAKRPEPKDKASKGLLFITKYGLAWAKDTPDSPITKEMRKLLDGLGINGHRNFYTLRHTHRTVGDETHDQAACDFIMGHARDDMASIYREKIDDSRLLRVTDHIRSWLFGTGAPDPLRKPKRSR